MHAGASMSPNSSSAAAPDAVRGDGLAGRGAELGERLRAVQRHRVHPQSLGRVVEDRLREPLGLIGVTVHPPSVDCASLLDDRTLERYAGAIVRTCLEIGPGDLLAVHGEPAHRELILAVTRVGYAAGADYVDVAFVEPALRRARVDNARSETLDYQPPWAERRMRDLAAAHGA